MRILTNIRLKTLIASGLVLLGGVFVYAANGDTFSQNHGLVQGLEKCKSITPGTPAMSECIVVPGMRALRTGRLDAYMNDIKSTVTVDKDLYPACHQALHRVGQEVGTTEQNYVYYLDNFANEAICDWGMGHGIFDGLAERGENPDIALDVIRWCETKAKTLNILGVCLDGVGHYIWGSSENVAVSAQTCLKTSVPQDCAGGVGMQMFASAGTESTWSRDLAETMFKDICKQWDAQGGAEHCAWGAGYIFGLDVQDAMWDILGNNRKGPYEYSPPLQTEIDTLHETLAKVLDKCASMNPGKDSCISKVSTMGESLFSATYGEIYAKFCAMYDTQNDRATCMGVRKAVS